MTKSILILKNTLNLILKCNKSALASAFSTRHNSSASSISDKAAFPGYKGEFSTNLEFIYPENNQQIQCYRVMNRLGVVLDQAQDPKVINKMKFLFINFITCWLLKLKINLRSTKKLSSKCTRQCVCLPNSTRSCTKRSVRAEFRSTCKTRAKQPLRSAQPLLWTLRTWSSVRIKIKDIQILLFTLKFILLNVFF